MLTTTPAYRNAGLGAKGNPTFSVDGNSASEAKRQVIVHCVKNLKMNIKKVRFNCIFMMIVRIRQKCDACS